MLGIAFLHKPVIQLARLSLSNQLYSYFLGIPVVSLYFFVTKRKFIFEDQNLSGFASWMRKQAQEEYEHAMRFYKYVVERGGSVKLASIKQPPATWASPLNVFEETLKHEMGITAKIHGLVNLAQKESDKATSHPQIRTVRFYYIN